MAKAHYSYCYLVVEYFDICIVNDLLTVISQKLNVNPKITSHTNRRESLAGSDFVQTTIQVGGYKPSTIIDFEIPKKFNGEKIYYRFLADGKTSDIGMTSTLPSENPNNFNIAFCSCSNYPAGYFNAYKEIAKNKKIDLVLHLGDYLYEYGHGGYASKDAEQMGRVVNPIHELISLDDYRKRYATYRSDPDLKLLHQKKPMISVWDDHEFTNDSWQKGAQNHSKDEGTFANRKKSALQAYYEWMPIREKGRKDKIWRNFRVGNLINLMMLDTRSYERDKQLDIEKYFDGNSFKKNSYLKDINKPRKLLGKEQFNWIRTVSYTHLTLPTKA